MRLPALTPLVLRLLPGRLAGPAEPLLRKVDAMLSGTDDRHQAGRTAILAFFIRVFSAVLAYIGQVILARMMGSYEYGIYVVVWAWMLILSPLSGAGLPTGVLRLLPEMEEKQEHGSLRGYLLAAPLITLLLSVLFVAVGVAVTQIFPQWFNNAYLLPLLLILFCLPAMSVMEMTEGIARACDWPVLGLLPLYVVRPMLILAGFGVAIALDFPATAATAAAVTIIASWMTLIGKLLVLLPKLRARVPAQPRSFALRYWINASLPLLLVEGAFIIIINSDILIAGMFLPPDQVAVYFAAAKTLALVHFVYYAVRAGTSHKISRLHSAGDQAGFERMVHDATHWTFWPSLAMALVLMLFGNFILSLFGSEFTEGAVYLYILLVGVLIRASVGPAESILSMSGEQKTTASIFSVVMVVNVGMNFLLIWQFGLIGAAIATALAMLVESVLLALTVKKRIGVTSFIIRFGPRPGSKATPDASPAPEAAE